MRVYFRLSVCAAVIGFIGAVYSVLCLGTDDSYVIMFAENVFCTYESFVPYMLLRLTSLMLIFVSGLCSFGWLTVLPILFFRIYSLSFAVVSFIITKEATVLIPPLLVLFIVEMICLINFVPIAAEFSLSIVKSSTLSFSKRFFDYVLLFILHAAFVSLSSFGDMIASRYY